MILGGAALPAAGWAAGKALTAPWITRAAAAPGMFPIPGGLLAPRTVGAIYPAATGLLGQ